MMDKDREEDLRKAVSDPNFSFDQIANLGGATTADGLFELFKLNPTAALMAPVMGTICDEIVTMCQEKRANNEEARATIYAILQTLANDKMPFILQEAMAFTMTGLHGNMIRTWQLMSGNTGDFRYTFADPAEEDPGKYTDREQQAIILSGQLVTAGASDQPHTVHALLLAHQNDRDLVCRATFIIVGHIATFYENGRPNMVYQEPTPLVIPDTLEDEQP
jgi:hypothetical protein